MVLAVGMLLITSEYSFAQQVTSRYFAETGHTIQGDFLTFYMSAPDPLLVYGLPITEAFFDPMQNVEMQYFQRARFELIPDAPAGSRVKLSPLGALVYEASMVQPVNMATNTPACRQYSEFFVCYAFLAFFDAHGGLAQFGHPISNYSKEGDLYVQYFERARFEYHPELSTDTWVLLTDIGSIQFRQSKRDPRLGEPASGGNNRTENDPVTHLQVRAYASKAVVTTAGQEGLTVIVIDQKSHIAVQSALVSVKIDWPAGKVDVFTLPPTDMNGISRQDGIAIGDMGSSQFVLVEVNVTYGNLQAATTTWFFVWW